MKQITGSFKMHVDASLFAFKYKDAQYVEVNYKAQKDSKGLIYVAPDVSGPMYLLGMIVIADKWYEFSREVEKAAIANAEKRDACNIHPTIRRGYGPVLNGKSNRPFLKFFDGCVTWQCISVTNA